MIGVIDVGGGMRATYGAGIFDYCLDNNITFDYFCGISAGSANGMSFLAKQRGRNYRFFNEYSFRKEYMSVQHYLHDHEYLDLNYIYGTMSNSDGEDPLDYEAFMSSPCKMEIIATDAVYGIPCYFNAKSMQKDNYTITKMSCAIPIICKPVKYNGHAYYDGGISNPIPYEHAFKKGCDKLVIVLTRPKDYYRSPSKDNHLAKLVSTRYKGTRVALKERADLYNRQLNDILALEEQGKLLIVAPDSIGNLGTISYEKEDLDILYNKGYQDASAIPNYLNK